MFRLLWDTFFLLLHFENNCIFSPNVLPVSLCVCLLHPGPHPLPIISYSFSLVKHMQNCPFPHSLLAAFSNFWSPEQLNNVQCSSIFPLLISLSPGEMLQSLPFLPLSPTILSSQPFPFLHLCSFKDIQSFKIRPCWTPQISSSLCSHQELSST